VSQHGSVAVQRLGVAEVEVEVEVAQNVAPAMERVVAVRLDREAVAYPFSRLHSVRVMDDVMVGALALPAFGLVGASFFGSEDQSEVRYFAQAKPSGLDR